MLNATTSDVHAEADDVSLEVDLADLEPNTADNVFLQPTPPDLCPWETSAKDEPVIAKAAPETALPRFAFMDY